MGYRKYDPMIKKMIIETGNRNLFPELNIPRTTINYWLKESKEKVTSRTNHIYEQTIRALKKENFEQKARSLLAKKCLEKLLRELGGYDKKSKENRKFVVETIESFKGLLSLKEIINVVGICQTTYYRWKVEVYGCNYHIQKKKCITASPTQLTMSEQRNLVEIATSVNFRKFSTVSLMHYCRRKEILNISLESWYKYLKLYGIERKFYKHKRKCYKRGIRAKKVNEIWHIDITILKYGDGEKAYLQLLVDNYSRLIVAWKLSEKKTMDVTYKTILKSFNFAPDFNGILICDGGAENLGSLPRKLLIGKGIKQLVAKKDIRFSNSMVEAVFRQFKQKFYLKPSNTYQSLYRLVYKFVRQYNRVIPHSSLEGGTPLEVFTGEFVQADYKIANKIALLNLRDQRRQEYESCIKCSRKYLRSKELNT